MHGSVSSDPTFMHLVRKCGIVCIVLMVCGSSVANAQLLPGELKVDLGRELLGSAATPQLKDVMEAVARPDLKIVALIRLHADNDNHFAPSWTPDGRRFSFLRSNLLQQTSKICWLPQLNSAEPNVVYSDTFTYEHMPVWSAGPDARLAFSTNNTDSSKEAIHISDAEGNVVSLTAATESSVFPSAWCDSREIRLLYRRNKSLMRGTLDAASPAVPENGLLDLGDGEEAVISPDGRRVATIRKSEFGVGHILSLRNLTDEEETTLWSPSGHYMRNPVWSPDGQRLALYSRDLNQTQWALWSVALGQSSSVVKVGEDVRVQEDFRHVGPAWSADSAKLWYLGNTGAQGHYPLRWASFDGQSTGTLEYPQTLTNAMDVQACRNSDQAALTLVAVSDRALDVFIILLNHH